MGVLTKQEGGGKRVNILPLVHCLPIKETIFVKIFILSTSFLLKNTQLLFRISMAVVIY